jgi:hypothetical protein
MRRAIKREYLQMWRISLYAGLLGFYPLVALDNLGRPVAAPAAAGDHIGHGNLHGAGPGFS